MRLTPALLLVGCATPVQSQCLPVSGVSLVSVDGAELDASRVDAAAVVAEGMLGFSKLPTVYLRTGSHFQCMGQEDSGCHVKGDIAIATENPERCPYALLVHELVHYSSWLETGDGDPGHSRPDLWGNLESEGAESRLRRVLIGLCERVGEGWR